MGEIIQSMQVGHYGKWKRVKALFDSGANFSFLKSSIAKSINAPKFRRVKTILGDGSKVDGVLSQINVKIGNRIGLADVIIIDKLDGDLFLGQNFMQKNDIILNMQKEKLQYGKGQPRQIKIFRMR